MERATSVRAPSRPPLPTSKSFRRVRRLRRGVGETSKLFKGERFATPLRCDVDRRKPCGHACTIVWKPDLRSRGEESLQKGFAALANSGVHNGKKALLVIYRHCTG